jgi:hypothetical protein
MPDSTNYDDPKNTPIAWATNDKTTAYLLRQLNNLIAANSLQTAQGTAKPAFPKWNALDPTQIPVHLRRRKSNKHLSKFCINRQHHLYDTWKGMIQRCHNPRCKSFHTSYGAKNIGQPWTTRMFSGANPGQLRHMNFLMYTIAIELAGRKSTPQDTIDRINPHHGYHLSNMRWADKQVQANNKCPRPNPYGPWQLQNAKAKGWYSTVRKMARKPSRRNTTTGKSYNSSRSNNSNRRLFDMFHALTPSKTQNTK